MFVFIFFTDPSTTEIYTLSYTTLFRSGLEETVRKHFLGLVMHRGMDGAARPECVEERGAIHAAMHYQPEEVRSEEHTSELQSLTNLVCRLLLEKKKKLIRNKQTKKSNK